MITLSQIQDIVYNSGFSHCAPLCMESLVPLEKVRDMCNADKCRVFGRCWSCPPACGSIEFCAKRMGQYNNGFIVQTTGEMSDQFDIEAIGASMERHKKSFETLVRQIRTLIPDCLPLTAGGCSICLKCTYPDKPCRFPKRMMSSMEAYGLLVSDVCIKSGLQYNYGSNTITYSSCVLFNL